MQSDGSARKWRDLLTLEAVGFDEICIMRTVTAGGGVRGKSRGKSRGTTSQDGGSNWSIKAKCRANERRMH